MTEVWSILMKKVIKGLIFDMDGTLLDTLNDIAVAMNDALHEMGSARHSLDEYKELIGSGIADLAREVLPPERHDTQAIEIFVSCFRQHYALNWCKQTKVFPSVMDLISELDRRAYKLAILSNKSQHFTTLMAEHWFQIGDRNYFNPILGAKDGVELKPDPGSALAIAELWGLEPEEIAFVGDADIDMQTAIAAGMLPIGVAWGFSPKNKLHQAGAQILLEEAPELLIALDQLSL